MGPDNEIGKFFVIIAEYTFIFFYFIYLYALLQFFDNRVFFFNLRHLYF